MSVCVYSVYVILSVGCGLATGLIPVQGVLTPMYRIKKLKKRPRSNKRAVEPLIITTAISAPGTKAVNELRHVMRKCETHTLC
jgi:hypothetical protein